MRITPSRSSPSGRYFVDSYSRPDVPPVTIVRDENGKLVSPLEIADISGLVAAVATADPVTVKARDGVTDLYGLMFRADAVRLHAELSDHQSHLPGTADRECGDTVVHVVTG